MQHIFIIYEYKGSSKINFNMKIEIRLILAQYKDVKPPPIHLKEDITSNSNVHLFSLLTTVQCAYSNIWLGFNDASLLWQRWTNGQQTKIPSKNHFYHQQSVTVPKMLNDNDTFFSLPNFSDTGSGTFSGTKFFWRFQYHQKSEKFPVPVPIRYQQPS